MLNVGEYFTQTVNIWSVLYFHQAGNHIVCKIADFFISGTP